METPSKKDKAKTMKKTGTMFSFSVIGILVEAVFMLLAKIPLEQIAAANFIIVAGLFALYRLFMSWEFYNPLAHTAIQEELKEYVVKDTVVDKLAFSFFGAIFVLIGNLGVLAPNDLFVYGFVATLTAWILFEGTREVEIMLREKMESYTCSQKNAREFHGGENKWQQSNLT